MADFVEAVVDAIYDRLTTATGTTLSTVISGINTEKGDTLLSSFENANIHKGYQANINDFPCIVIEPDSSEGYEPSTGSLDCHHIVNVAVLVVHDQPIYLHQSVWRYLRAITEHLFDNWTLDDAVDKIDFLGHYYEQYELEENSAALLRVGTLRMRVHEEVSL